MPTQQLVYEGTDLQALIRQVVDEHGPARIRPPERRRTGGVLGFFAREVYVISVDPRATEEAGRDPSHPAGSPASLSELIDATVDDLDLGSAAPSEEEAALADRLEIAGTPAPHEDPVASPAKPFDDVLREVASSLGEEPGTYRADRGRIRRITPLVPPPARPGTPPPAPAEREEQPEPAASAPPRSLAAAPATAVLPAAPVLPVHPLADRRHLGPATIDLLLAAGCPARLLGGPEEPGPATLEEAFARLPSPPALPTVPGALIAVVGDARLVRPLARSLAAEAGCPPEDIAVAAPSAGAGQAAPGYRVRTPEQAAALAPGWRRDRVGVVAVYAPALGTEQDWTRAMLHALRPSCVWATTTATTKPEDVGRWLATIGGADALALTDVGATTTPAAVCGLDVPVARLDGELATPARWSALVAGLLARS